MSKTSFVFDEQVRILILPGSGQILFWTISEGMYAQ